MFEPFTLFELKKYKAHLEELRYANLFVYAENPEELYVMLSNEVMTREQIKPRHNE